MRLVPVAAILLLVSLTGADAADSIDAAVDVRCLPLQFREGAEAYRDCVADAGGEPRAPALDGLSLDDRHAIASACTAAADRERCVSEQLAALEDAPDPFLDMLEAADRHAIRRECAAVQDGGAGVARYRRCLDDALAAVETLPVPDVTALALPERNALDRRCARDEDTAVGFRRCRLDALGAVPGDVVADADGAEADALVDPVAATDDAPAPDASSTTDDAVAAGDTDADALTDPAAAPGDALASDAPATTDDAVTDGDADAPADALAASDDPAAAPDASSTTDDAATDDVDADAPAAPDTEAAPASDPSDDADAERPDPALDAAGEDTADGRDAGASSPLATAPAATSLGTEAEEAPVTAPEEPAVAAAEPLGRSPDTSPLDASEAPEATDETLAETSPVPSDRSPAQVPAESGDDALVDAADAAPSADDVTGALEDPDEAPPPDLGQRVDDARERLLAAVAGLDGTERIVLAGALVLPLLLVGFRAATGGATRRAAIEPSGPPRNPALVERISPPARHGDPGDDLDDDFFGDIDAIGADGTLPDDTDAFGEREAMLARHPFDDEPFGDEPAAAVERADFEPRSGFGRWLLTERPALRRRHATEFLIYWMAYGDERYDPEVRAALLRDGGDDGNPHDLIKRRVLERDTQAFADAVRWLQAHAGETERVQIIDLLMVLLVNEGAMTPSQNTLFHFLADAFGLGQAGLDRRHEEAFGRPMPPLARVDLAAWWDRVDPARASRWDAHAVAALDERDQHRVRLGLPLGDEADEADVVAAFRRAAARCQPHRFDALGERERTLAERQFAKFEEARDRLLGVDA